METSISDFSQAVDSLAETCKATWEQYDELSCLRQELTESLEVFNAESLEFLRVIDSLLKGGF